jgi:hypothetical protein
VPKLYRRSRRAIEVGERTRVAVLHHELAHAAESVERFAARELLPLLADCRDWDCGPLQVTGVRFGVQRAEVELAAPQLGRDLFIVAFENVGGTIEATIAAPGWTDRLSAPQRSVLVFALRGLFDLGAAARFGSVARTPEAVEESGFGGLTRTVAWDDWVKQWEAARAVPAHTYPKQ